MIDKKKKPVIYFSAKEREVNKRLLFSNGQAALEWRNLVHNFYTKALVKYNVEEAKACEKILREIKLMAENLGIDIRLE